MLMRYFGGLLCWVEYLQDHKAIDLKFCRLRKKQKKLWFCRATMNNTDEEEGLKNVTLNLKS